MAGHIAVYAGSFDPITCGHVDLVRRGAGLFEQVILAVGSNPSKRSFLPLDVRMDVMRRSIEDLPNVQVRSFDGLLVHYCREVGAGVILRGLRAVTDFEFEFQIGLANMDMAPDVQTVFLLTDPSNIFISSSLVREIATNGGDVSRYVPPPALSALQHQIALVAAP